MTEAGDSLHNSKIKTFEPKVINSSLLDLKFYDKLADYLLECCHAEAKPNTLSLFSFLPLFILSLTVSGPTQTAFIFTILCIFIHQLLDIANKKQAYRLSSYTLGTFYTDHLFDSLSCTCLILVICRLLELSAGSTLTAIFFFGILPFSLQHLAMYTHQYLEFQKISPTTQGLVFTKLLFVIACFNPSFFQITMVENVTIADAYIGLAAIWLIYYVGRSIYRIVKGKRITDAKSGIEQHLPLKNVVVILMIGYLIVQIAFVQQQMIEDRVLLYLVFSVLSLLFAHIIGRLVLAYGYNEGFKQITLPFLITMGVIVFYYALLVFFFRGSDSQIILTKVLFGFILGCLLGYLGYDSCKNIQHINQVISG